MLRLGVLIMVCVLGWQVESAASDSLNVSAIPASSDASPLGDMAAGRESAPVVVVEYGSMTCIHCAAFQKDAYPAIKSAFIDTGKIRFVFREFPLEIKAAAGSMLARCVAKGDSRRYFDAVDVLFERQSSWAPERSPAGLRSIAAQLGVSGAQFSDCLSDQSLLSGISRTRQFAIDRLSVEATPAFFVNGKRFTGEPTFEALGAAILSELNH